jgi:hypothetical protein
MKNIIMKTVKKIYKGETFEVRITQIRVFPRDVLRNYSSSFKINSKNL